MDFQAMDSTFRIAVGAGTGIGGSEKAAVLFANELQDRGHTVSFLASPGPRESELEVPRIDPPGTARELATLLQRERIQVLHQHVPGYPVASPVYEALQLLGEKRPRLLETNVFGRLEDPAGEPWVDFRGFISRASAVQAFRRAGRMLKLDAIAKMTVIGYPLAPDFVPAPSE